MAFMKCTVYSNPDQFSSITPRLIHSEDTEGSRDGGWLAWHHPLSNRRSGFAQADYIASLKTMELQLKDNNCQGNTLQPDSKW